MLNETDCPSAAEDDTTDRRPTAASQPEVRKDERLDLRPPPNIPPQVHRFDQFASASEDEAPRAA